jgi:hypothetical protein
VSDWLRLLSLFEPETGGPPALGGLFVMHDGLAMLKMLHTRVGRLEPTTERWPGSIEALLEPHQASWGVGLHVGALEEMMERLGARAQRRDDIVDQLLALLAIVRDLESEGAFSIAPWRVGSVPLPGRAVIDRGIDVLCPVGKVILVGLFEGDELWTCISLRRAEGGFDLIEGPDEVRAQLGLLSGDFRRDHRHLTRVIERRVGPLGVGLFTEVRTLRRLIASRHHGSWARAVAVRDIVVVPMSGALAIPLGVDAARGAVRLVQTAIDRFDTSGTLGPIIDALQTPPPGDDRPRSLTQALRTLLDRLGR